MSVVIIKLRRGFSSYLSAETLLAGPSIRTLEEAYGTPVQYLKFQRLKRNRNDVADRSQVMRLPIYELSRARVQACSTVASVLAKFRLSVNVTVVRPYFLK